MKSRYLWSYSEIEVDFLRKICTFEWALDYIPLFQLLTKILSAIRENCDYFNPLSANPTKSSNTIKIFVGSLTTNCLSVFDHFVWLALKSFKFNLGLFWLFMWLKYWNLLLQSLGKVATLCCSSSLLKAHHSIFYYKKGSS